MSFSKQVVKGVSWSAVDRLAGQFVQLATTVVLSRMLVPEEFGLIAILLVFVAISQSLVDCGLSQALIQKNECSESDFATVFHFNCVMGILIYVTIYLMAPAVASLFEEPDLIALFQWMGLIPLIQGLAIIQITKLTIRVEFKILTKASLTSLILSSVAAIFSASRGAGVWAIVLQLVSHQCINTFLLWIVVDWRPRLVFSRKAFTELFSFGWKLLVSGLLASLYVNVYNFLIGLRYSAKEAGLFSQASVISRFPSIGFMAISSRAVFPIQCEIKNNENLLLNSFKGYLQISHFVIFPIMLALAVLCEPLISLALTDAWLPMSKYFFLLCFAYSLSPVIVANNQMLLVKGRPDLFLRAEIVKKVVGVLILLITVQYGIEAICIGVVLYNIVDAVVGIFFSMKVTGVGYFKQARWIFKSTLAAVVAVAIVYFAKGQFDAHWIEVLFGLALGFTTYICACWIFRVDLPPELFAFIKGIRL